VKTFRLLILGAGFSKPANFPLADELFREVRNRVKTLYGNDNPLERDIKYYFNYLKNTEGFSGSIEDIKIEKLLSFLDVEHYLDLKGSDTWSSDGNPTQLLVRHTIGYVLLNRTPKDVPEIYKQFAKKLTPSDWVLTFNYDTLLEQALESVGVPYRLFPNRYSEIGINSATVDTTREEVVVLKMHGSIDWFDKHSYNMRVKNAADSSVPYDVKHPIFGANSTVQSEPIVDGLRVENDPLLQIYRVKDLATIYSSSYQYWECPPFLLNPSHNKLLYVKPIVEFWSGLGVGGGLNLGLGIIGYSLPDYDDYARQAIYKFARNYQQYEPDFELGGRVKQPARILDFRPTDDGKAELQRSYQFMDKDVNRTQYWYKGLSSDGIEWLMA
jgi:hypothetical protein